MLFLSLNFFSKIILPIPCTHTANSKFSKEKFSSQNETLTHYEKKTETKLMFILRKSCLTENILSYLFCRTLSLLLKWSILLLHWKYTSKVYLKYTSSIFELYFKYISSYFNCTLRSIPLQKNHGLFLFSAV